MNKIYLSKNTSIRNNEIIEDLSPIKLGDTEIVGYKISYLTTDHSQKGSQGEPLVVVDKNINPTYDEITQLFQDRNNLQTLLAQSTANNAQASVDVENLKQQNAQLVQQIAQLQIQGGSNNG